MVMAGWGCELAELWSVYPSGISIKPRSNSAGEENDPFSPSDEYMEMGVGHDDISSASSDESDGYTDMSPLGDMKPQRSRSLDMLDQLKEEVETEQFAKSCVVSSSKTRVNAICPQSVSVCR